MCRIMRDLELEVRGRHWQRNHEEHAERSASVGGSHGKASCHSGSRRFRDWSQEYVDRDSVSPKGRRPRNAAMNAMSWSLRRAAWSPFLEEIERALMSSRFTRPSFISYDRKIDPMKHVSHYIRMMSLHNHNDVLMCRVFPFSLRPTALRWFNELRKGSIHSFGELI